MTETRSKEKSAGETPPGGETGYRLPLTLQRLYVEEQKTGEEIAELYGITNSTVYYWLDKHGIETRGEPWKAPENGLRYEMTADGHMSWRQTPTPNRENHFMFVHRLVAVAEYGADAVAGNHIHHKNGIPWDNRPENLKVLSPSEHMKLHGQQARVSREDLLEDLVAGYEALGYTPTVSDVEAFGEYGVSTYRDRFGSIADALIETGIRPRDSQINSPRLAARVESSFGEGSGMTVEVDDTDLTHEWGEVAAEAAEPEREKTESESENRDENHGGRDKFSQNSNHLSAALEAADADEVFSE